MAIQERRGNYADLDTSKLVQGEPFVTLDQVDGDYYAGIAIGPNNVIRFATWDNLVDIRTDCEQYRDDAQTAAGDAATSETNSLNSALDSEAWAVGQKNGVDVPHEIPCCCIYIENPLRFPCGIRIMILLKNMRRSTPYITEKRGMADSRNSGSS